MRDGGGIEGEKEYEKDLPKVYLDSLNPSIFADFTRPVSAPKLQAKQYRRLQGKYKCH
jgi:hypothetical protein